MGRRGCASAMGMIKFPSSCSSPKALCNQFIDYYICSRGVFCINHIKLRNFVVITIECSIATVDRGSIMTRIYRWSMMVYSSLQAEFMVTKYDGHIHRYGAMISHTIDSYQIPGKNKTKSKLQIWKIFQKSKFLIFAKTTYTKHITWSCIIRCANITWIWLVLWKLQSRHDSVHRRMDRWTDGGTSLENLISAAMKQAAPHIFLHSFFSSSYWVICVHR